MKCSVVYLGSWSDERLDLGEGLLHRSRVRAEAVIHVPQSELID